MNLPYLKLKICLLTAALILSATLAPLARADGAVTVVRRHVSGADLNLATEVGARQMYMRLKAAARSLCHTQDPVKTAPSWIFRECVEEALAGAIISLDRTFVAQAFINDYGGEASGQLMSRSYRAKVDPVKTLSQRIDP